MAAVRYNISRRTIRKTESCRTVIGRKAASIVSEDNEANLVKRILTYAKRKAIYY